MSGDQITLECVYSDKYFIPSKAQCKSTSRSTRSDRIAYREKTVLFVADVPDEDQQLSRIIDVVTSAYDHQNFLTKGFLS